MTMNFLRSGGITFFGGISILISTMIGPGLITSMWKSNLKQNDRQMDAWW